MHKLEIVDQWSTRIIPAAQQGVAVGNVWIGIKHHSKLLGYYLLIHMGNVLLKFGSDVQSQTEVRVQNPKNPIWMPGGLFESDIAENQ